MVARLHISRFSFDFRFLKYHTWCILRRFAQINYQNEILMITKKLLYIHTLYTLLFYLSIHVIFYMSSLYMKKYILLLCNLLKSLQLIPSWDFNSTEIFIVGIWMFKENSYRYSFRIYYNNSIILSKCNVSLGPEQLVVVIQFDLHKSWIKEKGKIRNIQKP